jgi:hypothetical protein
MTEEVKPDPIAKEIMNFSFTVEQINSILQILANTPYVLSAPLIAIINMQGESQFQELLAKEKAKNESKATAKK